MVWKSTYHLLKADRPGKATDLPAIAEIDGRSPLKLMATDAIASGSLRTASRERMFGQKRLGGDSG